MKRSVKDNDVTIVSVFLNPTQFNDKGDLDRYPRTLDDDCKLIENCGADYVFAPSVEEMYPLGRNATLSFLLFLQLWKVLDAQDILMVSVKLLVDFFYITRPNRAYFGEKDWQQIAVIKQLVKYIGSDVNIIECPIVRESDGLAKSSRNALLSDGERFIAPAIFKSLSASVEYAASHSVSDTHDNVVQEINSVEGLDVEYFEIVDGNTLNVKEWSDSDYIVGCITVNCGRTPIRLIDHIKYKEHNI